MEPDTLCRKTDMTGDCLCLQRLGHLGLCTCVTCGRNFEGLRIDEQPAPTPVAAVLP